jgi:hypothetical protein
VKSKLQKKVKGLVLFHKSIDFIIENKKVKDKQKAIDKNIALLHLSFILKFFNVIYNDRKNLDGESDSQTSH